MVGDGPKCDKNLSIIFLSFGRIDHSFAAQKQNQSGERKNYENSQNSLSQRYCDILWIERSRIGGQAGE
jgi:hypothetical protein